MSADRRPVVTLLRAITEHSFDAVFGRAHQNQQKAPENKQIFSVHDWFGHWMRDQRPEVWNLYNGRHRDGEHHGYQRRVRTTGKPESRIGSPAR